MSDVFITVLITAVVGPVTALLVTFGLEVAKTRKAQAADAAEIKSLLTKVILDVEVLKDGSAEDQKGRVAIIRDRISQAHRVHVHERKSIDDFELQSVESMYAVYEKTEKNSFVSRLMEDIRKLPIKDRGHKDV